MNITLTNILSSDCIGNSLSSLNDNFQRADTFLYYMNLSAYQLFEPLMNFWVLNKDSLKSLITTVQQNSAKWESLISLVSINSSKWINPVVYIHPVMQSFPITPVSLSYIVSSFKKLYPILPSLSGNPYFVENQKAILYYYTYATKDPINDNFIINSNYANCVSEGVKSASIWCQDSSGGTTSCDGDDASCSGCARSCSVGVTVSCIYPETKTARTNRFIRAKINNVFLDRYEKELRSLVYTVKNCEWVFERNLI